MPPTLPIDNPVLIFALAMVIFLVAPRLFQRIRIPGIVGLILAGTVVGPHVLGLLERDFTFQLLGTVGLLYLIFQAGLELDLNRFREYRNRSLVFGLLSFGLPMGLSLVLLPRLGFETWAAALMGAVVGSHTLLAYPVASRIGITRNRAVITVVGGTLVTDTLALGVLAAAAGAQVGDASVGYWMGLGGLVVAFVVGVMWAVPRFGRWFFRNVPGEGPAEFLFLMVVLFVTAWGAELAGAEPIIGAFLAGLALNRLIPLTSPLMSQVRFVGNAFFIPFFLLSVGMLVDPVAVAESPEIATLAGALVLLVLGGKLGGAWLSKMIFRYDRYEALTMVGLSTPQAAATLAVTFVGLELGLLDEPVVNAVIVLILVTVVIGPSLVDRFGREVALHEERKPYDPSGAPRRVLISVSNPSTADAMLDIAFALREDDPGEPVYPVMVVHGRGEGSEAEVAEAEKILSHAVLYAAEAEVPVTPLTRVDPNIATGIARAAKEIRSSVIVVGWGGRAVQGARVFSSLLDQLLEMTKQLVIVAKLGHPLNTTRRFVVVVPEGSHHHPGFSAAVFATTTLAGALEASVFALVVGEDSELYREGFEEMPPRVPVEMESVEGWGPLLGELRHRLRPDDLVVVLSGRPGTLTWRRELRTLPRRLASLVPESFLFVYAPDAPVGGLPMDRPEALPPWLSADRIVLDLQASTWEDALEELFRETLLDDPDLAAKALERTVAAEREFTSEVSPGVALPHALVPGLESPLLFLGISRSGLDFPGASEPIHVVFAILSPPEDRQAHLRVLSDLARTFRSVDRPEALAQARSLSDVARWFRSAG
ncbi:MAG: cation:proton antiporter [Gemmatimonadota bacterium]